MKAYQPGDQIGFYNEGRTAAGDGTVVNYDTDASGAILGYEVVIPGSNPSKDRQVYVPVDRIIETDEKQEALFSPEPVRLRRIEVNPGDRVRMVQRNGAEVTGVLRFWDAEYIELDLDGFRYKISVLELAGVYAA